MHLRRRAGLRSFPVRPRSGSACRWSDPKLLDGVAHSPSGASSTGVSAGKASSVGTPKAPETPPEGSDVPGVLVHRSHAACPYSQLAVGGALPDVDCTAAGDSESRGRSGNPRCAGAGPARSPHETAAGSTGRSAASTCSAMVLVILSSFASIRLRPLSVPLIASAIFFRH